MATREMLHSSEEHQRLFGLDPEMATYLHSKSFFGAFIRKIRPGQRNLDKAIRAERMLRAFPSRSSEGTTRYMHGIGILLSPVRRRRRICGHSDGCDRANAGSALRDGESRILEMIARDAPLEEILEN